MSKISEKKIIFFIILIAFFIRLIFALAPIDWLLERGILPDDAFYYFKIAENIAAGHGISFDGFSPTNGFHPLWMAIISPIFLFIHQKIMAVHFILIISAIISSLAVWILYKIFLELNISLRIRLFMSGLFAFLPTFYISAGAGMMNGLETPVNVLFIFIFILNYLKVLKGGLFIPLGIVSGFLFLARTDNAILLLIAWLFLIIKFIYNKSWLNLKKLVFAAIAACAVVSPWLIWSYLNFGEIIQVSGKAIPFVAHQRLASEGWNFFDYFTRYLNNIADSFIYLFGILIKSKYEIGFVIIAAIAAIILSSTIYYLFKKDDPRKEYNKIFKERVSVLSPFAAVFFIFIMVQTIRVVFFRSWYHFSVLPISFLFAAVVIDYFFGVFNKRFKNLLLVGGGIYAGIILFTIIRLIFFPLSGGELGKYYMIKKLNEILPANSVVGSWNAGIYGYFFEKGKVVNLDGVVNNEVYPYIKVQDIREYAKKVGINYLVDESAFLKDKYWDKNKPLDNIEIIIELNDLKEGIIIAGRLKENNINNK